ncbi:hypothetical protein ALC62_04506 [Cyphomyrmex costatus]|uniref:THAP-type domain-containing protein n=1 Tax=Cyphomyrmex costatus TaxID=456900 RepID=A0A151IK39_9HYME|nr:hypothetical protein ALC62_04506 [Cyphomyrmex costatus]
MPSCILKNCCNRTFRKSDKQKRIEIKQKITFHMFPKNEYRRKHWCEILQLPENSVKPTSVICSMHFHEKSFDKSTKLKADANPYLSVQASSIQKDSPIKCTEQICTVTSEKLLSNNDYHTQSILDLPAAPQIRHNISTEHRQMDAVQNTDIFNMEMPVCKETANEKRGSNNIIGNNLKVIYCIKK